jgi:lipopolysaccharide transport system ATP-binding protein
MSDVALELDRISKKFRRGELYDSLRDWVPALIGRLFGRRRTEDLSKKEFWALKDISLTVKSGEVLGIIGHNGAGKSTMLKLLSGVLKPTKGSIHVNGKLSALIEIGAGFHQDLTGRQNIYLNAAILGMKRSEITRKFDQIVAFSGLEEFLDTPVKRYSTGMYARLGFSVASHVDPDILLVDEVLSVGDYAFQNRCVDRMKEIVSNGAAVVFVSHNLHSIVDLCTRAMMLDHGTVVSEGAPQDVIRSYLNQINKDSSQFADRETYVSRLVIRGCAGPQVRFASGEDAWLDIEVHANAPCERLSLSIYLQDEKGQDVFNTATERLGLPTFSLEKGQTVHFSIRLRLNLVPGAFNIGTRIYRYDLQKMFDEQMPLGTFFITCKEDVRGVANLYPVVESFATAEPCFPEALVCGGPVP